MKPLLGILLLLTLLGCSGSEVTCSGYIGCNTSDTNNSQSGNTDNNSNNTSNGSGVPDNTGNSNNSSTPPANGGPNNLSVTGLTASHRAGQTFLVWDEPNNSANYHVYRSNQPITTDNLSSATLLTNRWGPLDSDTSVNKFGMQQAPDYFVINDLGAPLSFNRGLFVHTTKNGQSGNAWYAVTTVLNGTENKTIRNGSNALSAAVSESVSTPRPVLTISSNGGKGRIYTQYMDYADWNPTFNGYAYNYAVALPANYNPSRSYALQLQLHAYGAAPTFVSQSEFDWQVIQLFPSDPGESQNTVHTWWYGHAADHNYNNSRIPTSGNIENFTEQRVIRAVNEVVANSEFNINSNLIHAYGNSMGASGAISLAMRYPGVFAGVYASQPMTNYATSPTFQDQFIQLWGQQSSRLGIVNGGPNADAIRNIGANGNQPTNVWDWMNHQQQLPRRRSADFAFMMMDFGKADNTIDWATQGRPMFKALTDAKVGFSATAIGGVGHNWLAFNAVNANQFGLANDDPWLYPRSLSFVALQNASGSGPVSPGPGGTDNYNTNLEWSTPHNAFHQNIVDSTSRYEVSLRSLSSAQNVSVTPRNTRSFKPGAGKQCSWTTRLNSNNTQTGNGSMTVDNNALVTAVSVPVATGNGTRLIINCP